MGEGNLSHSGGAVSVSLKSCLFSISLGLATDTYVGATGSTDAHIWLFSFLQFCSRENGMPPLPSPSLHASWLRWKMESAGGVVEPQWLRAWPLRLEREDSSAVLDG